MTRWILPSVFLVLLVAPARAEDLASPADIPGTGAARSRALFEAMVPVLLSPRCVNCHPAGRRPRQGEDGRLHQPPIVGGPDGHGVVGMQCATCHGTGNYDPAGVPGAPGWHLAPASMAWEGLTPGQLCAQLKDPSRNGGRDLAAIVEHMRVDPLVGWGWKPGVGRKPAPGSQAQLGALAEAWAASGAACPE